MEFKYIDRTNKITNEDIINDLLHVKNDILKKDKITMREYRQYGKYGSKAIVNHFGTWNKLLDKLSISKTKVNEHLSKGDIFLLIKNCWEELGEQPTLSQFSSMTHHTSKIIVSKFGTWSKCLREFVEWIEQNKEIFNSKGSEKHNTSREISKSLRYDVLKRDGFKCVMCGRSPATNPSVILHVDHIIPYSLGGETTLSNLQTLCSACNLGKSNKKN